MLDATEQMITTKFAFAITAILFISKHLKQSTAWWENIDDKDDGNVARSLRQQRCKVRAATIIPLLAKVKTESKAVLSFLTYWREEANTSLEQASNYVR